MDDQPCENTDVEIWRETPNNYSAPSIFVTEHGGIGINVGGLCIVKDVRDWHLLGVLDDDLPVSPGVTVGFKP